MSSRSSHTQFYWYGDSSKVAKRIGTEFKDDSDDAKELVESWDDVLVKLQRAGVSILKDQGFLNQDQTVPQVVSIFLKNVKNALMYQNYLQTDLKLSGDSAETNKFLFNGSTIFESAPDIVYHFFPKLAHHKRTHFVDMLNHMIVTEDCKLVLNDEGGIELNEECKLSLPEVNGFIIKQGANLVAVGRGFSAGLEGNQIIGILAHELAHYLLGHHQGMGNRFSQRGRGGEFFSFSYDQDRLVRKPLSEEEDIEARELSRLNGLDFTINTKLGRYQKEMMIAKSMLSMATFYSSEQMQKAPICASARKVHFNSRINASVEELKEEYRLLALCLSEL